MATVLGVQVLGQAAADLVEHQTDQRLGSGDIGRRHDEIERRGLRVGDEISDPPIAAPRHLGHHGIAVKAEERHCGGQYARSLVVGFVEQLARRGRDDGVRAFLAKVRRGHHRLQRRLDRPLRIGQKGGDAGERLIRLGIEDVQDRADQQGVGGLFPMVALVERAFRIDQNVGDVLHVTDFPFAAPHLQQRIIGGRLGVGRIEQQHAAMPGTEAGGELPVLALDVVDDRRARPGQQRGHHQADALAGTGRREAQHMLRAVVAEIGVIELAKHNAVRAEKPGRLHLSAVGPAGGAVGLDVLRFARPPDRHANGNCDRDEAAGRRDIGALDKDRRRIGVVEIPPPEEGRRVIDRPARNLEPWMAELRLEAKAVCRPLRRGPGREQHDQEDDGDLAPEDFRR